MAQNNPKHKGQGLTEYGLLLALISLLTITALQSFGQSLFEQFFNTGERIRSTVQVAGTVSDFEVD